jgi:carbon monoxide dehydrogenase subunit G
MSPDRLPAAARRRVPKQARRPIMEVCMHLEGTHTFRAPRAQVWSVLLDPAALAGCLPGCEGFHPVGEGRYEATLTVGVANVKGTYKSTIELRDVKAPDSYRLYVEGGGRPGSIKGEGLLVFSDGEDGTVVSYSGDVQVTGTVARVGQRLLGSVAKMMVGKFFECMDGKVTVAGQATSANAG